MRIIITLALALSACATSSTGPRPVNVAAVRHEIDDQIQAEAHDRSIVSMGHVTSDRAVIYTSLKTGARQEETWVKTGSSWKLDRAQAMN